MTIICDVRGQFLVPHLASELEGKESLVALLKPLFRHIRKNFENDRFTTEINYRRVLS